MVFIDLMTQLAEIDHQLQASSREGPCRSKLLSFLLSKGLVLLPIYLQFQLYPLFFLLQSLDLKHNKLTVFSNMLQIWQQPLTK